MRKRPMKPRKPPTCSICGTTIKPNGGRETLQKTPMWLGFIDYGFCDRCDRGVVVLYDERKRFIGTQSRFTNPSAGRPSDPSALALFL